MANVQQPDFVRFNRPENEIRISTHRHAADYASRREAPDVWIPADRVDCAFNGKPNAESAAWASLIKIVQNLGEIALRPPRIADNHPSRRFQSASISASEANSPRLACARPSSIAVRVSLSSESGPARVSIDHSSISAVSSCSAGGNLAEFRNRQVKKLGHNLLILSRLSRLDQRR
jgi:hypothetical protein